MEVMPGYKQTEVGVIPDDWESSKLGHFSYVTKLAGFEYTIHFDYAKSGPVIAVRALNIKNGRLNLAEVHTIPRKTSDDLPRSKLAKGDLVISYVGTLGRVAMIPEDNKFHLAPNVAKICVDKTQVAPEFLAQFLNSFRGQKLIFDAAASTTQAALSMRNLRGIAFVRPPLPEQHAIATALSDVDAIIGGLDRLIAKKRNLKHAAMQQLLTGQTRLPGFHGEWGVKRLGEIAHIKTGSRNNQDKIEDGEYPFFVRSENIERINSYSHDCEAILVPGEGRIGDIFHYINGCFDVHQRVYAITQFKAGISAKFIHLYMTKNFGAWAMQNTVKATVDSLRLPTFQTFEIRVPPTQDEQDAIAAVVSDMDAELAALESRRDKIRDLKQAMMQELLTGKTRLVPAGGAHA